MNKDKLYLRCIKSGEEEDFTTGEEYVAVKEEGTPWLYIVVDDMDFHCTINESAWLGGDSVWESKFRLIAK